MVLRLPRSAEFLNINIQLVCLVAFNPMEVSVITTISRSFILLFDFFFQWNSICIDSIIQKNPKTNNSKTKEQQ